MSVIDAPGVRAARLGDHRMSDRQDPCFDHGDTGHNWALVLAAGEGNRLRSLTTMGGIAVPKQFCSLNGGVSLLHAAIERARVVAPPERICVVVADHHRHWWQDLSHAIP